MPSRDVRRIVGAFTALEELNVYFGAVDANTAEVLSACAHDKLQRVGIAVDVSEWDFVTWSTIVKTVEEFVVGCPALRDVALYVRQDVGISGVNPYLYALRETLLAHGRQLDLRSLQAQSVHPDKVTFHVN